MPATEKVFECQGCGECCHGQGGIYLKIEEVSWPAGLLSLTAEEFLGRYTEPRHGHMSIKSGADGYCMLLDQETRRCRIHEAKPRMCRDWPFFYGPLKHREGFETARTNCPGILPQATWEDFVAWHRKFIKIQPPRSYIFDGE